jgi:hypothetical protein
MGISIGLEHMYSSEELATLDGNMCVAKLVKNGRSTVPVKLVVGK